MKYNPTIAPKLNCHSKSNPYINCIAPKDSAIAKIPDLIIL